MAGRGGNYQRRSFVKNERMSAFINELWDLDEDARCRHGEHYTINLQGHADSRGGTDKARGKLFKWVDDDLFERPTYKKFCALLDNYTAICGEQEVVTSEERAENKTFVEECMRTPVMQRTWEFLKENADKIPHDEMGFMNLLEKTWFRLYRRTKGDRDLDSSGFEHVFVGEIKKLDGGGLEVSGFHNWIQLYMSEKAGNLDYKGYFKWGTDKNEEEPRMLTLRFGWEGEDDEDPDDDVEAIKKMGSSFLGTSPEFEFAVYSACYFMGLENIGIVLADKWKVELQVHRMGPHLASCFPKAAGYV